MNEPTPINARAVYVNADGTFRAEFIRLWMATIARQEQENAALRERVAALETPPEPETP